MPYKLASLDALHQVVSFAQVVLMLTGIRQSVDSLGHLIAS